MTMHSIMFGTRSSLNPGYITRFISKTNQYTSLPTVGASKYGQFYYGDIGLDPSLTNDNRVTIMKFTSDMAPLWTTRINLANTMQDLRAIEEKPDGSLVYVMLVSSDNSVSSNGYQLLVLNASTGALVGKSNLHYNSAGSYNVDPMGMRVASDGNIWGCGTYGNSGGGTYMPYMPKFSGTDYSVLSFNSVTGTGYGSGMEKDANGNFVYCNNVIYWSGMVRSNAQCLSLMRYNPVTATQMAGAEFVASDANYGTCNPYCVAIEPGNGNIWVSGFQSCPGPTYRPAIWKFDSNFNILGSWMLSDTGASYPCQIKIDKYGSVYIVVTCYQGDFAKTAVYRFTSSMTNPSARLITIGAETGAINSVRLCNAGNNMCFTTDDHLILALSFLATGATSGNTYKPYLFSLSQKNGAVLQVGSWAAGVCGPDSITVTALSNPAWSAVTTYAKWTQYPPVGNNGPYSLNTTSATVSSQSVATRTTVITE